MASLWTWGIDYKGQPLLDAWWTPGWTSQNDSYIQVPPNNFSAAGFPANLTYVTVIGSYFDSTANPISGYMTFWPSSPLTFTIDSQITYMPQRLAGINESLLGINQMGDGKIYLQFGNLIVNLLATDQSDMQPPSFKYHVVEHFIRGNQYDITIPSTSDSPIDIHDLIVPGTVKPNTEEDYEKEHLLVKIPVVSTQYVFANAEESLPPGVTFVPSSYPVNFAFVSGYGDPQTDDWVSGTWITSSAPYVAQCLVGPNGTTLAVGTYKVWLQIIASPQEPVMPVGYIEIY